MIFAPSCVLTESPRFASLFADSMATIAFEMLGPVGLDIFAFFFFLIKK